MYISAAQGHTMSRKWHFFSLVQKTSNWIYLSLSSSDSIDCVLAIFTIISVPSILPFIHFQPAQCFQMTGMIGLQQETNK